MTIIDTTTVSALLVVLAIAVLATIVTVGLVLARVYSAHRPTVAGTSYRVVHGRVATSH